MTQEVIILPSNVRQLKKQLLNLYDQHMSIEELIQATETRLSFLYDKLEFQRSIEQHNKTDSKKSKNLIVKIRIIEKKQLILSQKKEDDQNRDYPIWG